MFVAYHPLDLLIDLLSVRRAIVTDFGWKYTDDGQQRHVVLHH